MAPPLIYFSNQTMKQFSKNTTQNTLKKLPTPYRSAKRGGGVGDPSLAYPLPPAAGGRGGGTYLPQPPTVLFYFWKLFSFVLFINTFKFIKRILFVDPTYNTSQFFTFSKTVFKTQNQRWFKFDKFDSYLEVAGWFGFIDNIGCEE